MRSRVSIHLAGQVLVGLAGRLAPAIADELADPRKRLEHFNRCVREVDGPGLVRFLIGSRMNRRCQSM